MVMYCQFGVRHNGSHRDSRTRVIHGSKFNGDGCTLTSLQDQHRTDLKIRSVPFPIRTMSIVKGMSKKKKGKREK